MSLVWNTWTPGAQPVPDAEPLEGPSGRWQPENAAEKGAIGHTAAFDPRGHAPTLAPSLWTDRCLETATRTVAGLATTPTAPPRSPRELERDMTRP
jgi:hypothetical protein